MNKKKFVFASIFASMTALAITACGDDVTKINEIHQDGMAVLEAGQKLSKQVCDTTNVGEMLFVMDSSEAFICDGKSWQTLKGEKGETGDAGKDGSDGANGTSCTVKSVKNKDDLRGLEVTCGKTVVDTIWNGAAGKDGKPGDSGKDGSDGANGTNCTAKSVENDAGLKGFELTCGETVVGTIWNGKKGGDGGTGKDGVGCSLTDDGNGSVVVTCGEGDDETITNIYKAVCGTVAYDPAKAFCLEGEVYDLCGGKTYEPKKQFCDTRDNQIYGYVTIAVGGYAETWMAENLNYSVNPGTQSWCGGGNDDTEGDCSVYGRLYTWAAAVDACPEGWHLPSKDEWDALITAVGGPSVVGRKLKADSDLWTQEDGISNDDSYGFSALPAGLRSDDGNFTNAGYYDYFLSASENNSGNVYYVNLGSDCDCADLGYSIKDFGYSVRCLQN